MTTGTTARAHTLEDTDVGVKERSLMISFLGSEIMATEDSKLVQRGGVQLAGNRAERKASAVMDLGVGKP